EVPPNFSTSQRWSWAGWSGAMAMDISPFGMSGGCPRRGRWCILAALSPDPRAPPMPRRYVQLDVFASRPGAGNPLAVVVDAEGLDDAAMQAIARWTRLPETTFVFPATSDDATHRIRIFSPRREVPFAGHPSVGTAYALLDAGLVAPREGFLVQDGIAGKLPLRVRGEGAERTVAVRTPRARVQEIATPDDPRLRDALAGLKLGALPPVLMDGGRRWWLAE